VVGWRDCSTEGGISEAGFLASDVEPREVDRRKDADVQLEFHVDVRTRPTAARHLHAEHCTRDKDHTQRHVRRLPPRMSAT